MNPSPVRFNCPSCRQKLSIPPEHAGQQIACPSCGTSTTVPQLAPEGSSPAPKVAAAALFVAVLGGGAFLLKGRPLGSESPTASSPASPLPASGNSATQPSNLADQIHGKAIKRSGSSNWEVVFPYYEKTAGATQIMFSNQERKGKLAMLPGRLTIDQVGDGFITATHSGSREQWVLHPDSPKALDEISLSEGTSIAQLVGVYAGPEQMETTDGAPRRLPSMIVFGMLTTKGYVDFEAPEAAHASTEDLKPYLDAQASREASERAKEKAETDAREAERHAQRAKDIAELERDPSWNPKAKQSEPSKPEQAAQPAHGEANEQSGKPATADLAKARADLAAVNSKIESERKRYTEALNLINKLTNFKTKPVKEGSTEYHRCMEASRIIGEVEKGAADLKAEKARLETLVGELDPEVQE